MLSAQNIQKAAFKAGFDRCGIVAATPLSQAEERFRRWLDAGNHSSLAYLERNLEKRFHPARLVEGAKTVVVCALSYKNAFSEGYPPLCSTKIASYALMRDYHLTIKERLHLLAGQLLKECPTLRYRAFSDSAPLAEKPLAVQAGLGWQGRNSLLIVPGLGTYLLLGELLLNEEVDRYDTPFEGERCGSCRACVEACPVGAIRSDRTVDTRRCIACRTIERGEGEPIERHGWLFGCDRCQQVCPHNRLSPRSTDPALAPCFNPLEWSRERWLALSQEAFEEQFGQTPLVRCGLEHLRRLLVEE